MLRWPLLVAIAPLLSFADRPADNPCVTWVEASQKGALNSSWDALDQFIPAIYSAWQWKPGPFTPPAAPTNGSCPSCDGKQGSFNCAYIFPCYSDEPGANGWGHRDTSVGGVPRISFLVSGCNTHLPDGNSSMANSKFWLVRTQSTAPRNVFGIRCAYWQLRSPMSIAVSQAGKGPQWQHFGWQVAQEGGAPADGIGQLITDPSGEYVLARASAPDPFPGCGAGNVGWVKRTAGKLGCMNCDANVVTYEQCNGYEVAYCKVCKPCPPIFNSTFDPGPGCPRCQKPSPAPPPPPPSPPPPAPPGGTPCIRFANSIPSPHAVDATISQGSVTHSWTNYHYSQFSGWISVFHGGKGQITIKDSATQQTLLQVEIPLTPGPLVVVVKDSWPPTKPTAVETIAASFVPPKKDSAVRLFNLAGDVKVAGLSTGGKTLVDQVQYSLGSSWKPVATAQATFSAFSDTALESKLPQSNRSRSRSHMTMLASAPFTPPSAPQVFTTFLLGSKSYGYTLLPQVDAPEFGPCKPLEFKQDENR